MLQAFVVVFSTSKDPPVLPGSPELYGCIKQAMDIPREGVGVNLWPVELKNLKAKDTECRSCGDPCEEGRLFCNGCSDEMVEATVEEEYGTPGN